MKTPKAGPQDDESEVVYANEEDIQHAIELITHCMEDNEIPVLEAALAMKVLLNGFAAQGLEVFVSEMTEKSGTQH